MGYEHSKKTSSQLKTKSDQFQKKIAKQKNKFDSITNITFSKMGNNEVPHDVPYAYPSAKTNIPPSTTFFLDPGILT